MRVQRYTIIMVLKRFYWKTKNEYFSRYQAGIPGNSITWMKASCGAENLYPRSISIYASFPVTIPDIRTAYPAESAYPSGLPGYLHSVLSAGTRLPRTSYDVIDPRQCPRACCTGSLECTPIPIRCPNPYRWDLCRVGYSPR